MINKPPITAIMPCYKRPERTLRMVWQIALQTLYNCEVFIVGDGCPVFNNMMSNVSFQEAINSMHRRHYFVHYENKPKNEGGYGYSIINECIQKSCGEYLLFLGNDDCIRPDHFEVRGNKIHGTDMDFMYFDTYIDPIQQVRNAQLEYGKIGHSELIVRSDFAKKMPPHDSEYGHDWRWIQAMMGATKKYAKAEKAKVTYSVMSLRGHTNDKID